MPNRKRKPAWRISPLARSTRSSPAAEAVLEVLAPQSARSEAVAVASVVVCPVCRRRSRENVSIGIGPLQTSICASCARTGFGLAEILSRIL